MSPQKPETGFLDRLGGRFLVKGRSGDPVEILIFRDELVTAAGFEAAMRGAAARLADFRHPSVRRVRGVARLAAPDNRLALVSDASAGRRLSDILLAAERENRSIDTRATLCIVRDLLAGVHALHESSGGVCHGALGPERIVVAPDGRVFVVEHVLASALDCHTAFTQEQFWRDYRVAIVEEEETPRFGQRTDVLQAGLIMLALVLGRLLRRDEFPRQVGGLLLGATESGPLGSRLPVGLGLRAWLARALQLGSQDSYATVGQALKGLEQVLEGVDGYAADSTAVAALLAPEASSVPVVAAAPAATDSGPHAVAAPDEQSHATGGQPNAPSLAPVVRTDATASMVPAPRSESGYPPATASTVPPVISRAHGEEPAPAAASDATAAPVSVDSLSTPAGVDCIAADVRSQVAATPRSGTHRAVTRPPIQARADTSRQAPDDVRPVQTPATPAPPMFGAGETAEMPVQPGIGRNWIAIGAAAAGLILVVGVPSIWLLTRSTTPKPVPAAADARPAASEISMDPIPAGPPPPAAPVNTGRAAGARTAAQGAALATPPGGAGANAAQPPAAIPADAGARGGAAAPPAAPPAVPVGRISVTAPLSMLINEKGYQLGVSPGNAIPLPVGRHDIELVNESIGFRETRSVEVTAGRTAPIVVTLPKGTVSFNAIPWAEVWADGQKIGETPVANVEMAAGPHEVSFRHPQLGERRLTVVVPVNGPQRVSMDMRKQ